MSITKSNSVLIKGPTPLNGTVSAQGSKNSSLPILSALLLLPEVEVYNVPDLSDTREMVSILEYLGASVTFKEGVVKANFKNLKNELITEEFSSKMRASSLFMGPLLAKFGSSSVAMPGGCVIGSRPLDIHISGFETLGATTENKNGVIHASVNDRGLEGEFSLPFPSVGATQNLICASVFSPSKVVLRNIAIEPEVIELIQFLNKAGAKIKFSETNTLEIKGVKKLKKTQFSIQADRIEVFTLLVAGVATKGSVKVVNCEPEHLKTPLQALVQMGAKVEVGKNFIQASYVRPLEGIKVTTGVHPSFPTDCQQQISILMLLANSPSLLIENVFNSRFRHLDELQKMGAKLKIEKNVALIEPSNLTSASLDSFDLRGAASMVISGVVTPGSTKVTNLKYLYRGYEGFIEKLNYLGADIVYI